MPLKTYETGMKLREHEGFQIRIVEIGGGHIAEIYRKEKLLKTIRREDGEPFRNAAIAHEAAKNWIDRTYSKRIKYRGGI